MLSIGMSFVIVKSCESAYIHYFTGGYIHCVGVGVNSGGKKTRAVAFSIVWAKNRRYIYFHPWEFLGSMWWKFQRHHVIVCQRNILCWNRYTFDMCGINSERVTVIELLTRSVSTVKNPEYHVIQIKKYHMMVCQRPGNIFSWNQ